MASCVDQSFKIKEKKALKFNGVQIVFLQL